MHEPADAADMTQEAFVRLMRSLHTYRGDTKFTTWLYRLVTNICLDELRRRKGVVESLDNSWDDEDDRAAVLPDRDRWAQPEERLELRETSVEVRAALGQLAPMQRLALTLYYFGELKYEEIVKHEEAIREQDLSVERDSRKYKVLAGLKRSYNYESKRLAEFETAWIRISS